MNNRLTAVVVALCALCIAPFAVALEPNQIALVINRNEPKSRELAEHYARARGIPAGRVIELDLPVVDALGAHDYEPRVAEPIRQFLKQNQLDQQVRCLVTFYGVPLRVGPRVATPDEQAEIAQIVGELKRLQTILQPAVLEIEALARRHDPAYAPPLTGTELEHLARRADSAGRSLSVAVQRMSDPAEREKATAELTAAMKRFSGPVPASQPVSAAPTTSLSSAELQKHATQMHDPAARAALREHARHSGAFGYAQMLLIQTALLNTEQSDVALDSELALLWVPLYPRAGWQPNPLHVRVPPPPPGQQIPQLLMTARLDGPDPDVVKRIIDTSIEVEKSGLQGQIVIDSRGLPLREPDGKIGAFGAFDEQLRNLGSLIRTRAKLKLMLDEKPDVLAAGAVDDVAVYCGWYSVSEYVPGMKFNRGAVGAHIASFTMQQLHATYEGDWARGLLADGCVATYGAVSEPLLHAFPAPDDFFPLLLAGRASLAECYWRTVPHLSWKMCLVGDPLYTPYKSNPALRVEDLPPHLQRVFSDASSAP